MMQKRTALKLVLAGAAAAMLAGCGDKTEAPKEAAAPEFSNDLCKYLDSK